MNQDERTRLSEIREKLKPRIVSENNKLIFRSKTISCLKEDSKHNTTSKENERHNESRRLNESRKISETIDDEKEKKKSRMNENITEHATSIEAFQLKTPTSKQSRGKDKYQSIIASSRSNSPYRSHSREHPPTPTTSIIPTLLYHPLPRQSLNLPQKLPPPPTIAK